MVTIDPNNLQNLVQRQIFFDPGDGQINLRIMLGLVQIAMASDLDDKKKSEVFDLILVTALKLTSVHQHKDRYNKLEDELVAAAKARPIEEGKNEPQRYATAQSLYLELDGLLACPVQEHIRPHGSYSSLHLRIAIRGTDNIWRLWKQDPHSTDS